MQCSHSNIKVYEHKWYVRDVTNDIHEKSKKSTGFAGQYFEWVMDTRKYMYVCCDITATYLLCLYLCNHHKHEISKMLFMVPQKENLQLYFIDTYTLQFFQFL